MRVRFLSVSYRFGSSPTGLQRHYQELREAMVSAAQAYPYLRSRSAWRPPMDIHETEDALLVKLEIAGVDEDDLDVALYPNALVIHGIRRDDVDHTNVACFHAAQVRYGPFHVEVALPAPVHQEDVNATYRDGFLRVRLPKATPGAPRGSGELPRVTNISPDTSHWQARAGSATTA